MEYDKVNWTFVATKNRYRLFTSVAFPGVSLLLNDDKGVIVDHQKGARKVTVLLNGNTATITAIHPKIYHDGVQCSRWLAGLEIDPEDIGQS